MLFNFSFTHCISFHISGAAAALVSRESHVMLESGVQIFTDVKREWQDWVEESCQNTIIT